MSTMQSLHWGFLLKAFELHCACEMVTDPGGPCARTKAQAQMATATSRTKASQGFDMRNSFF
jgi:hypothetical protein